MLGARTSSSALSAKREREAADSSLLRGFSISNESATVSKYRVLFCFNERERFRVSIEREISTPEGYFDPVATAPGSDPWLGVLPTNRLPAPTHDSSRLSRKMLHSLASSVTRIC